MSCKLVGPEAVGNTHKITCSLLLAVDTQDEPGRTPDGDSGPDQPPPWKARIGCTGKQHVQESATGN